jgi:ribose transport system permease protein
MNNTNNEAVQHGARRRRMPVDFRRNTWILAALFLTLLCIVNRILQPNFFESDVMLSNLTTFLPLILIAIGQTYVILASDIDLSVGAIVSLVNVVVVSVMHYFGGSLVAVLAGIGAGVITGMLAGAANGLCVATLRFQPIITTFATGTVFAGMALWILPDAGSVQAPEPVWRTYGASVLGIPFVVWVLVLVVVGCFVYARSRAYLVLLAVGGDIRSAFQSGLSVMRTRIVGYVMCGFFCSLGALALTGETATGDPLIGLAFTLASISAVVLGGTALSGGVGGVFGSILGAILLGLISNVIFFAGTPFEYQNLIQGVIVLVALAGGVFVARGGVR